MRPRSRFPKAYADFVQRLRVIFGFLLLAAFAWLSQPAPESMLVGIAISLLGLLLRAWAAGHLAKDRQLATSGPYAYIRNPLYLGTLIAALGIVIASRSVRLALIFAIAFIFVYLPAVELEEQHLREIFPEYASYAAHVHRFLPTVRGTGSEARFRWTLYRRNEEYKALLGFVTVLAWLIWKGLHLQTL